MSLGKISRNEAFAKIRCHVVGMQRKCLDILAAGPKTAWEISAITGDLIHSVRPRLTELAKKKIIHEVSRKYETITQTKNTVYAINYDGDSGLGIPSWRVTWKERAMNAEKDLSMKKKELEAAYAKIRKLQKIIDICKCKHRLDDHAPTDDGKKPCADSEFCECPNFDNSISHKIDQG